MNTKNKSLTKKNHCSSYHRRNKIHNILYKKSFKSPAHFYEDSSEDEDESENQVQEEDDESEDDDEDDLQGKQCGSFCISLSLTLSSIWITLSSICCPHLWFVSTFSSICCSQHLWLFSKECFYIKEISEFLDVFFFIVNGIVFM